MLIKELNKLNEKEKAEIKELVSICNKHDSLKGFIDVDASLNFKPAMKAAFMLYNDKKLVSVLTVFAPGSEEAELTAMTLPQYRRKGYFTELFKRAMAELRRNNIHKALLVCESASAHGKAAIASLKANYEFTEYLLKYNHLLDAEIRSHAYRLKLYEADIDDLELIVKLSMSVFNNSYEDAKSIIKNNITAQNRELYLCQLQGLNIGMGAFSINDSNASLNGLGILSEYQGSGFGREMLYLLINKLLDKGLQNIYLEVDSSNKKALELYRSTGFDTVNAWEYYRIT